jgi:hypothetical protein
MSDQIDRLEVFPVAKGSGVEPEEAPARRTQAIPLNVNLAPELPEVVTRQGRPALDFKPAAPIITTLAPVTTELSAGEVALRARERCAGCANFRNEEWRKLKKIWQASPPGSERRMGYTKMLIHFARSVLDHDPTIAELNRASDDMRFWGVCSALSEEKVDLVITHPEACCPEGFYAFKDRDKESRRASSAAFDKIMRAAQGRT